MLVTEWDIDAFTDTNGPSTLEYSFAIGMEFAKFRTGHTTLRRKEQK